MKKTILIILDGWGIGDKSKSDAIFAGKTPYIKSLLENYPNSQLLTSGENVGLPDGVMGNSEVGHMNIGSGRIVYQDLVRINKDIANGQIANNQALNEAFNYAKENNKSVHFLGLLSDGGVHSMNTHLYKLCDITQDYHLDNVFIHVLTDGRDTDPKSGYGFLNDLQDNIEKSKVQIASVTGRYYTMDRDKRWERIKIGYDALTEGVGYRTSDLLKAVKDSYEQNITDEFINPIINIAENGQPVGLIKEGDVVIAFNYRTDRLRQITYALTQQDMPEHGLKTIPLHYVTMTNYDASFKGLKIAYDKPNLENTLGEIIEKNNLNQLRIAETEKYAHVTFFFSGGREKPFKNEERLLVNSPKVATYDLQPEMSAFEVKQKVVDALNSQKFDFIALNFANGDMVGHTGIYDAILKAVNAVDQCVNDVVETAKNNNYSVIIIADHGNADFVVNSDGTPNTQHSLNPVPCILVDDDKKNVKLKNGILADVAPTICKLMDLQTPEEMTGKALF
ncbi:MAG: 2,3-bisphosphoglycerate-independent phosphoglycerate mutase [Bacteroidales bacterium]|nr:2,3-bisphosphoglycerate-independent phosphoglycerate mutase [Bacteroidales bacterium]